MVKVVDYSVLNMELPLYVFASGERSTVSRGAFAWAQLNLAIKEAT